MSAVFDGMEIKSILLNCHIPIGPNSFELRFGCMVKKVPGWTNEQNEALAIDYVQRNRDSFYQDVDIWTHKVRINNPVLAEGDEPDDDERLLPLVTDREREDDEPEGDDDEAEAGELSWGEPLVEVRDDRAGDEDRQRVGDDRD